MLNQSQKSEIANYLLSKKLPIDIMLELQDHFISQINAIELEENLNFDKAFEKTKVLWMPEFKMVNSFILYSQPIPKIVKSIYIKKFIFTLKKSFFYTLPFYLFLAITAKTNTLENFEIIYQMYFLMVFVIVAIVLLLNIRTINFINKNKEKISFIESQNNVYLIYSLFLSLSTFLSSVGNSKYFYAIFNGGVAKFIPKLISSVNPLLMQIFLLTTVLLLLDFKKNFNKCNLLGS